MDFPNNKVSLSDLKPSTDPDFKCRGSLPLKNGILTCGCFVRAEAPDPITYKDVAGFDGMSRDSLRRLIIKLYAMSGFNNCRIQPLKMMNTDSPLRLFKDPAVKPVAIHKALIIPIHLKARVKADLHRDVRLGILEKVDINSYVKWLSHMLVTMKKDGSPRRIIDYKNLNIAIPRQTIITKSSFMCASACPPKKLKTILDAKDGYHSFVLEKGESQEVTEFLCEFGGYRCVGSGQGIICSGDAYIHRFNNITSKFHNVVRCVDDSLLWEDDLKTSFDLVCRYLSTCSRGGINFNKQKHRFAENIVEYVGFTHTRDEIRPTAAMTESIRNFPAPKNITQARAFFGFLEQVSFAFSKCADMAHFRHLLSPKTQFVWTDELDREFGLAKASIVRKIEKGVTMFEVDRITALVCDWSIE